MEHFLSDLRLTLRGFARNPGFAIVAVLTIALGIGATSAVFTLVDGVLLSPLPFREPQRLVSLQHLGRDGQDELPISSGLYVLYGQQAPTLESLAMYAGTTANVVIDGRPERVPAQAVTPSFFGVLGAKPYLGRTFLEEEGAPEGERAAVLSYGYWQSQFGGDPSAIGQTLDVNGQATPVVGVMPPGFGFPDRDARLWIPYVVDPANAQLASFSAGGIGRLAEGSNIERVTAELEGLIGRLDELFPESGAPAFLAEVNLRSRVLPLKASLVGDVRDTLWVLLGTVAFVLLIATANVANLLVVRAEGRQRELAVRSALGASRTQVARWFLAESLTLALAGGLIGTVIAAVAVRASLNVVPTNIPRLDELGVDGRVLAFAAVVTLATALIAGLFPILRTRTQTLADGLREGSGRGGTSGRERNRLRNGLVIAQIALALVLLIGSGLMYRSFQALRAVDPGFDADRFLTAQVSVVGGQLNGWEEMDGFYRQLLGRLAGSPGVEAVGLGQVIPLDGGTPFYTIEVEDHPRGPDELPVLSSNVRVSHGYFEALGIPLIEGRTLRSDDGAARTRAVVVSRAFARRWWPDRSPLGRRIRMGFDGEDWYTVVGVVGDVHFQGLEEPTEEAVYWPSTVGPAESPVPLPFVEMVVRTSVDPLSVLPVLRREVADLNPRIPVSNPRTSAGVLGAATARTSFTMALLGSASAIALLLGLIGIYGVISYVVSQRRREIGIRMAMGATAGSVRGMVVRHGLVLAGIGVIIGLTAAIGLSRTLSSILFGVDVIDPITYALVAALLVAVTAGASWIPAHRAARVDPRDALRAE